VGHAYEMLKLLLDLCAYIQHHWHGSGCLIQKSEFYAVNMLFSFYSSSRQSLMPAIHQVFPNILQARNTMPSFEMKKLGGDLSQLYDKIGSRIADFCLYISYLIQDHIALFTGKEQLLEDRKLKLDGGSNFLDLMATVDYRY
jgi:hypothetical protein